MSARRPCSAAVVAVMSPMQAIVTPFSTSRRSVVSKSCAKFLTVEELVKVMQSTAPPASRARRRPSSVGRRADGRTWARGERLGRTLDGGDLSKCQRDSINRFPWSRWWLLAKWVPLIGRSGDCRVGIHLAKMVDGHLCTFYRPRLESNKNGRLSGTAAAYVSAAEGLEGQVQFGHTKDGTLSQNHWPSVFQAPVDSSSPSVILAPSVRKWERKGSPAAA